MTGNRRVAKFVVFIFFLPSFFEVEATRKRRSFDNQVIGVKTSCDKNYLRVSVTTKGEFLGSLYARGYPKDCEAKGNGDTSVTLVVKPQECGVKIVRDKDGGHSFHILVYVQFDHLLQQTTDEQIQVTCAIDKLRDVHLTGKSIINEYVDKNIAFESTANDPQPLDGLNLISLFPPNLLQMTSKLQQMVNTHLQKYHHNSSSTSKSSTVGESGTTLSIDHKTSELPFEETTEQEATTEEVDLPEEATIEEVDLPEEVTAASKLTIEGGGQEEVPYKGVLVASSKVPPVSNGWKPIPPPKGSSKEALRKLLGKNGNDEMVSCWLQIVKGESPFGEAVRGELMVGEEAVLAVRIRRHPDTGNRITSCKAYDGSSVNVQELTDKDGCSVDEKIMPTFKLTRVPGTKEDLYYTPFKAFKFPDHDSLHIRCLVEICFGNCKKVQCGKGKGKTRKKRQVGSGFFRINPLDDNFDERIFGRKKQQSINSTTKLSATPTRPPVQKKQRPGQRVKASQNKHLGVSTDVSILPGYVLDIVEVFNSVDVSAHSIDGSNLVQDFLKDVKPPRIKTAFGDPEEKIFCITYSKLLAAFGILLCVFVGSLLLAVYWCIRDKVRRSRLKRMASLPHLSRFSHLPPSRFQGIMDYNKFPYSSSPYHRFHH